MKHFFITCVLLCVLFGVLATAKVPQKRDGLFVYTIFSSCSGCQQGQADGPSGNGTLFEVMGAVLLDADSVLVTDDGSAGSTVRVVNSSGVVTIAGSLKGRGSSDGPVAKALFSKVGGITRIDQEIYVVDTNNNNIRRISTGAVSTFLSNLNYPRFITPFKRKSGTYDMFISDAGKSRIVLTTVTDVSPTITVFASGFYPGELQMSQKRNMMYAIYENAKIIVMDATDSSKRWFLGSTSTLGYTSSLVLSSNESLLYYFANLGGNKHAIMAIQADLPASTAPNARPRQVLSWPNDDVKNLLSVDEHSFYVVEKQGVYLVRDSEFDPTPTPTLTPTLTLTLTPTQSLTPTLTKAFGTPTPTQSLTLTHTQTESETRTISPSIKVSITQLCDYVVAAFPTSALPVKDKALMHQLYAYVMEDVKIAFETGDYIAVFQPFDDNNVPGSVNVSTWRNLTTRMSRDRTITIMEFCPPSTMTSEEGQDRLFKSPWNRTITFLDSLKRNGMDLDEFCMVQCTDDCESLSYNESLCVNANRGACDDICKAAIASSVVLGTAGLALVSLFLASPPVRRGAFIMFPVI